MQSGWVYDAEPASPTQARNSGRAEQWIAGRGWVPRRGASCSVALFDRKPKDWIKCSYTQVRWWGKVDISLEMSLMLGVSPSVN